MCGGKGGGIRIIASPARAHACMSLDRKAINPIPRTLRTGAGLEHVVGLGDELHIPVLDAVVHLDTAVCVDR